MALLYRESDLNERLDRARPPLVVIDRRFDVALREEDNLLLGIQDVLGRSLNADADSLFYLIGLFCRSELIRIARTADNLNLFADYADAGNQETPIAVPAVSELISLLDEAASAGDGRQERIRNLFDSRVKQFARSSKTSAGAVTVGMDPQTSRQKAVQLLDRVFEEVNVLLANIKLFLGAVSSYKSVDFTAATRSRHILYARNLMEQHLGKAADNQSDAILDSVVVNSLLKTTAVKLDVEANKASGSFPLSALSSGSRVLSLPTDTPAGYPVRIGDVLLARPIAGDTVVMAGTVTWVSGLQVTVVEDPAAGLPAPAVNQNPQAPQYQFLLQSAGLHSFHKFVPQLTQVLESLQKYVADQDRVRKLMSVYANSGVMPPRLLDQIFGLAAVLISAQYVYQSYRYSLVSGVDELLQHLENERLFLVVSILKGLQFDALTNISAILSEQADVTTLTDELLDDALTGVPVQVEQGDSLLKDFYVTGRSA